MSSLKSAVLGGVITVALVAPHAASAQGAPEFIVQFREGTTPAARRAVGANAGAGTRFVFTRVPAAAFSVPNEQALQALLNSPDVVSVVPNRPVTAFQRQNGKPANGGGGTPSQVVPLGIQRVGVPTSSSSGQGVGVAILDTGVDLLHQDLGGTVNAFSAFGSSCQDDAGHGTHVAGIVGARDNAVGVIGVAPAATLYCVKVLDQAGNGSDVTVMAGLEWVLNVGASLSPAVRVVNMSLGRAGAIDDNPALRDLVAALDAAGIVVVASAGNDPTVDVADQIPAAYSHVISVASTTAAAGSNQCRFLAGAIAADTASFFTTDGVSVTVSAPGEDTEDVSRGCLIKSNGILSARLGGGTTRMSGTSMAAPHVAGIAARHLQQHPAWSPADVRVRIAADAQQQGTAPFDSPTGDYTFDNIREGVATAP